VERGGKPIPSRPEKGGNLQGGKGATYRSKGGETRWRKSPVCEPKPKKGPRSKGMHGRLFCRKREMFQKERGSRVLQGGEGLAKNTLLGVKEEVGEGVHGREGQEGKYPRGG